MAESLYTRAGQSRKVLPCRLRRIFVSSGGDMNYQVNLNIGRVRRWLNVSQVTLAKRMGASQAHISNIESGKLPVTPKMLARIAAALDITVEALVNGEVR